jgi:5-methylcytosine-specific restriction endonuclease McrA
VKRHHCRSCKQYKTSSDFYPDKSRPQGVMSECKTCNKRRSNKPYAQRNAAKHRAQVSRWRNRHPERIKSMRERRRARLKGASGSFTGREWLALCQRYEWRCLRCGQQQPLTPDHVKPLALGGANDISNIQPLCGPCNYSKGAREVDYRTLPLILVEQLPLFNMEAA